ncbi:MAG: winged helix-turn-helix transcriptional regulator [Candidatus Aenigmarchaeota archaeon]|nr:winged helix-turn-helix transcriptional regulator [Candidatus Aenigmarchaeota archaeon]
MSGMPSRMTTKKDNDYKYLFLRDKPVEMLVLLKKGGSPRYATQISKGVDCTYSHTIKVLEKFRELGLVEFKKRGRIKLISLTPDGEDIAHDFEGLIRKFERATDQLNEKKKKMKGIQAEEKIEKKKKSKK